MAVSGKQFRVTVAGATIPALVGLMTLLVSDIGCQKQFDLGLLPRDILQVIDTSYVEISPSLGSFVAPRGMLIGRDQLLYIADSGGNTLTMMNLAGQVLSTRPMLHPLCIAQDSRLDLLVGGEATVAGGITVGAIFRIHLVSANPDSAHHLELARIDTIWTEMARPLRRFPGITVFGDNQYLVARNGPDNSSFIDPDGRILEFNAADRFITPLPGLVTISGSGITDINIPTGIASFPGTRDFVLTQSSEGVAYGAIWMIYQQNADFDGWLPKFDPSDPSVRGTPFIKPNQYTFARAVTIDPIRSDIFIADAGLDSVFTFNSRGMNKSASFGFARTNGAMVRPFSLAYFEQILYVLEGVKGTILRFRLTTDVPR
jgi:hypothetical protein